MLRNADNEYLQNYNTGSVLTWQKTKDDAIVFYFEMICR